MKKCDTSGKCDLSCKLLIYSYETRKLRLSYLETRYYKNFLIAWLVISARAHIVDPPKFRSWQTWRIFPKPWLNPSHDLWERRAFFSPPSLSLSLSLFRSLSHPLSGEPCFTGHSAFSNFRTTARCKIATTRQKRRRRTKRVLPSYVRGHIRACMEEKGPRRTTKTRHVRERGPCP